MQVIRRNRGGGDLRRRRPFSRLSSFKALATRPATSSLSNENTRLPANARPMHGEAGTG
jgi:hypothetical protein